MNFPKRILTLVAVAAMSAAACAKKDSATSDTTAMRTDSQAPGPGLMKHDSLAVRDSASNPDSTGKADSLRHADSLRLKDSTKRGRRN